MTGGAHLRDGLLADHLRAILRQLLHRGLPMRRRRRPLIDRLGLRQRLGLRLEPSVDRADDGMDSGGEVGQVGAEEFKATVQLRRRRPANNNSQASTSVAQE